MIAVPPEPEVTEAQRASGPVLLRFEDVSQDGRITLHGLPNALEELLWPRLSGHPVRAALHEEGIVPVLSRLILLGYPDTISVRGLLEGRGLFDLAHNVDIDGAVNRVLINLWAVLHGTRGRMHGPEPKGAGESVLVGRVFAEHVFTRPFGPQDTRKVLSLPELGVPETRLPWRSAEEIRSLPQEAEPLDFEPVLDPVGIVFGLGHTDSNAHVNSLVYPRLFEEAALRRFATLGQGSRLLARSLEVGFRKPCFAGDRARIALRAYTRGKQLGAVGSFLPEVGGRAHCHLHMIWEP